MKRMAPLAGSLIAISLLAFAVTDRVSKWQMGTKIKGLARERNIASIRSEIYRNKAKALRAISDDDLVAGSVLCLAAERDPQLAKILLDGGVDPNLRNEAGYPALYMAALSNNDESIRILIEKGAVVDLKSELSGDTPLMACIASQISPNEYTRAFPTETVANRLLLAGANPNAVSDKTGYTALHLAAAVGSHRLIRLLLRGGADPNTTDNEGRGVLTYAVCSGDGRRAEILLNAGHVPTSSFVAGNEGEPPLGMLVDTTSKQRSSCRSAILYLIEARKRSRNAQEPAQLEPSHLNVERPAD